MIEGRDGMELAYITSHQDLVRAGADEISTRVGNELLGEGLVARSPRTNEGDFGGCIT
jgi:hypothetical protein